MKPYYLISTAAFAVSMFVTPASGQAQPERPYTWTGEALMQARNHYLKGFVRSPSVTAAPLVTDLTGVLPVLLRMFPDVALSAEGRKRLESSKKDLTFGFHVPVSVTSDASIQYIGDVFMRAYETLKEAEDVYVTQLSMLQVGFTPGTFTGQPVGEASAFHRVPGVDVAIYFLRKNVVFILQYHCPIEVPFRRDRGKRPLPPGRPDPLLSEKCEAFAREIDDFFAKN